MRMFAQSLKGVVKKWFRYLTPRIIVNSQRFEQTFLDRWEENIFFLQMLTKYNQLRRRNDESVKCFSSRFNMIYHSLPVQCKP